MNQVITELTTSLNVIDEPIWHDTYELLLRSKPVKQKRALSLLEHFGPWKLLRLLAESEVEELQECQGIGKKLSERVCRALTYLAKDMCRQYEVELSLYGEIPTYIVVKEDREVEKVVRRTVAVPDEHGWPVYMIEESLTDNVELTPWFVGQSRRQLVGWSGYLPWQEAPATENMESREIRADFERTGAGFLPEDLTGSGKLEKVCNEIVWSYRKEMKKARIRKAIEWNKWLAKNNQDKGKLWRGWKAFWKRYFELKIERKLDTWMTMKQIQEVVQKFESYGIKKKGSK